MEFISIFNDVLGPVMRGPSSSHTAGSFHIGSLVRSLMEDDISSARITFDPQGSYAQVYRQQVVDLAFTVALMGGDLTDDGFLKVLDRAKSSGLDIEFRIAPLEFADHPNTAKLELTSRGGKQLSAQAQSTGGGGFRLTHLQDCSVLLKGKAYETVVFCREDVCKPVLDMFQKEEDYTSHTKHDQHHGGVVLVARLRRPLPVRLREHILGMPGVSNVMIAEPVYYVQKGEALFSSAAEMTALAMERGHTLGELALDYEARLLGISKAEAEKEMIRRFHIMAHSVDKGYEEGSVNMQLLKPSAHHIREAETRGQLAIGGLHTRVAAAAMAAMHSSNSMEVVCAAPTGGAAGVIPGVMVSLYREHKLSLGKVVRALFAASAIGLILARRATFAAEVAGCQVEIGAAGAMAAAAVVEVAGGDVHQAAHAAAISFQNTMGSVCDLVQGMCEIPCHTRNATAASNALVNADLVLGGYCNPIPLDETIDAVYAVGKMLPRELRCTVLGGLAITPSAKNLKKLR